MKIFVSYTIPFKKYLNFLWYFIIGGYSIGKRPVHKLLWLEWPGEFF